MILFTQILLFLSFILFSFFVSIGLVLLFIADGWAQIAISTWFFIAASLFAIYTIHSKLILGVL